MRSRHRPILVAAAAVLLIGAGLRADVVERRGNAVPLEGEITLVTEGEVQLVSPTGGRYVVSWDEIRAIESDRTIPGLRRLLERGEALWRARTRLERRDVELAEPIFERFFEGSFEDSFEGNEFRATRTALVVAEGLLRCRLDRHDHRRAVRPMLAVLRLRGALDRSAQRMIFSRHEGGLAGGFEPVIDEELGLCAHLAPAFAPSSLLNRLAGELAEPVPGRGGRVEAVAGLYRAAVRLDAGERLTAADLPGTPADLRGDDGLELLRSAVAARLHDAEARRTARDELQRWLRDDRPWVRLWARHAIGAGRLLEADRTERLRGLVELAAVAAEGERHPETRHLAGLALGALADGLRATGDAAGAGRVEEALAARYPDHPVLERAAGRGR